MFRLLFWAAFLQCTISQQYQEKVAPGVPPQNYQQPNYQHQHQQPPPQQDNLPAPSQQHEPHGGHGAHGDPQFLNPVNMAHEKEHIQEHLDVPIDISKMTEHELQFYYFKLHDLDNNNKLDGCELLKSLIHYHDGRRVEEESSIDEIEGSSIIDKLLRKADYDADGFVTFPEWTYNYRHVPHEAILLKNGHYAYI